MGELETITRKVGMKLATRIILLLIATLSFSAVLAMQPITVPMEIRNSTGGIANDTAFAINFTFFDAPTGGIMLFNQTQNLTTDRFGRIFAILNTTNIQGNTTVWLELNVSGIVMTPRLQLTGALYSLNAERLQNQTRSALIGNFTVDNLTLRGNLTHNLGGVLINTTGGINATAVGFGSIPVGVLNLLFAAANTWTTTQTFNTTGAAPIQWSSNVVGANALGILTFATGAAADPTTIIYAGTNNRLTFGANARTADLILDRSGNFTIAGGNLSLTNALIHGTSGILINMTGGINASAVGFGSVPQGVLDTTRAWTALQNFTAGARFGTSLNVSGDVNVTLASGTGRFQVLAADGSNLLSIEDVPNTISSIFDFNLTNGGRTEAFAIRSGLYEIFRVSTVGGGDINVGGRLNITNMTHDAGGVLVNRTGGINASAVGFGTIPQGVLDVSRNWTAGQIFGQVNLTGRVNISAPVYTSGNVSSIFGGLLINETGGINASAIGFGTLPGGIGAAATSAVNTFTAGQLFTSANFSAPVNISTTGVTGIEALSVESGSGIKVFVVNTLERSVRFFTNEINITIPAVNVTGLTLRRTDGSPLMQFNTYGGGLLTLTGTLNITNITHPFGGLLVNSTGSINASAIGFGTLPSGIGAVIATVTNTFTTGQRFENVNVSGRVNITLGSSGTKPLAVYHSDGIERFSVETGNTQVNIASEVNITQTGIPALAVRGGGGILYFVVNTFAGNTSVYSKFDAINDAFFGNATVREEFNHSVGGLLVNRTGGINASAVGFGTIPQGVNQVYNNTGFTGGRVVFGKAIGIVHASNGAEVIVNMSTGFSCTACYSVVASLANSTTSVGSFIIINVNASQFNLTYRTGAAPEFLNTSWIAVGY